uniref:Uncharacterized protein n=1 Tax=Rhizophora mucronata TaxID=61149 RepID=A0A2P2Q309_RHIMU
MKVFGSLCGLLCVPALLVQIESRSKILWLNLMC